MNILELLKRLRLKYKYIFKNLLDRLQGRKYREIPIPYKPSNPPIEHVEESTVKEDVICIRNESDLNDYMKKVQDISVIADFLNNNAFGEQYVKYMDKYIERTKKFSQGINEFDEETTDKVVQKIIKLVENNLLSYLKGSYSGMREKNSEEKKEFYRNFADVIEQYLQSIGIYEKKINIGVSIRENDIIDIFETIPKPTNNERLINKIDEIGLQPHYIKFINEDDEEGIYYIKGSCVVFVKK